MTRRMRMLKTLISAGACVAGFAYLLTPTAAADTANRMPVTLRLSADQFQQIIADVFGPTIDSGGRFDPEIRYHGLLQLGAGRVSVTSSGLEQYDAAARKVAEAVVSKDGRATRIHCRPKSPTEPDDVCARQFLAEVGRLLFRRPMTSEELDRRVMVAASSAKTSKDFYAGLATALSTIMVSPHFLFREENIEPDPAHPGQYRLDAYSKATKLSFFLWNAAPDPRLLAAAESGELNSQKGLEKQVDRMIASPRLEAGARAFFSDMLGFNELPSVSKDAMLYPKFTVQVAADSREQTLRTLVDLLLTQKGDYRDIFTVRKTFLTPILGSIYNVPVAAPDGGWVPYEYPPNDAHDGVMMQISFLALHSHPGRSSPTQRGKALRETFLCQRVPDPPGNVDFKVVQDTANPIYKTARERLKAHATEPMCTGCHRITDPMGLAMENFDTAGSYRTDENGATIDASGELDGVKFTDAAGLGRALHDNPRAPACLVRRLTDYATGIGGANEAFAKSLEADFAASKYRLPDLMRKIATSDAIYKVTPAAEGLKPPVQQTAASGAVK